MPEIKYLKIVVTFFLFWLFAAIGSDFQNSLSYIGILSLGILHGANDIEILSKAFQREFSFLKILFVYLIAVLIASLIYFFSPKTAVILFILLSSYHFGEQNFDGHPFPTAVVKYTLYMTYGLFLFSILFYTNYEEVQILLQTMFGVSLPKSTLILFSMLSGIPLLFLLYIGTREKKDLAWMAKEILYLIVLFVFFSAAPLIIAFAVYFIIWHSVPSIKDQVSYLYGTTNLKTTVAYLKKSILFWSISLLFLVGIYYFYKDSHLFDAVLFAILFVVTVPHTLVIFWMHWKIKLLENVK